MNEASELARILARSVKERERVNDGKECWLYKDYILRGPLYKWRGGGGRKDFGRSRPAK